MKRKSETGQALVFAALGLTVLMLAAGLGIDMGYLRYEKRRMQTAADSAAIAGAAELQYGDVIAAARNDAASNGFPNVESSSSDGTITDSVTVYCLSGVTQQVSSGTVCTSTPNPLTTPYVGVVISQPQPTFFMRIVGTNSATVSAQAIAHLGGGTNCIYGLGNGGNPSIEIGEDPTGMQAAIVMNAATCGITDNGSLANYGNVCTNSSDYLDALAIGIVPPASYQSCSEVTPTPVSPIIPAGDPLSYLTPPSGPGGCASGGPQVYSSGTVPSGSYPCGLHIITNPGITVTLAPGIFALGGNGLTINTSTVGSAGGTDNGAVTGTGITFYATGTASININLGSSAINYPNLGSDVQISAPSDPSNPYAGVLIMQDPSDTQTGSITLNTNSSLLGALYFPQAQLNLNGIGLSCMSNPQLTISVAQTLDLYGCLNFNSSTGALPDPIKNAVLVE